MKHLYKMIFVKFIGVSIWFASVPAGESLDPLFILSFAGLCFCVIFGTFTLIDIKRGETSWEECRFFSQKRYLQLLKKTIFG